MKDDKISAEELDEEIAEQYFEEDDFEDIEKIHIFNETLMNVLSIIYESRQDKIEYSDMKEAHEQIAHEALSFAETIVNLRNSYIKKL